MIPANGLSFRKPLRETYALQSGGGGEFAVGDRRRLWPPAENEAFDFNYIRRGGREREREAE